MSQTEIFCGKEQVIQQEICHNPNSNTEEAVSTNRQTYVSTASLWEDNTEGTINSGCL